MNILERSLHEALEGATGGDRDFCVTLEAEDDSSKWVQLTWDCINLAYPKTADPIDALGRVGLTLPSGVELSGWKPGVYVTFGHGAEPVKDLVAFIDGFLKKVLDFDVHTTAVTVRREGL